MLLGTDRQNYRAFFFALRKKLVNQETLTPLEQTAAALLAQHPEYHAAFDNLDANLETEYSSADLNDNPFMHLGLHMAIIEQLQMDKPPGIRDVYTQLLARNPDEHAIQHQIMQILSRQMWEAMQQNTAFNEAQFLAEIQKLVYTS